MSTGAKQEIDAQEERGGCPYSSSMSYTALERTGFVKVTSDHSLSNKHFLGRERKKQEKT